MATPTAPVMERDLAAHDAALAAKAQVMPDLHARLAYINTAARQDKFLVLQGLKDVTAGGDPKCYYFYQREGQTGSRGHITVDGPMLQPKVAAAMAGVIREKTGVEWSKLQEGHRALPGKYWLQQQSSPDRSARWEYYVSDGVDGKQTGWYPYAEDASGEVEEIYAQHVANGCEARTWIRWVSSGYFVYEIDLTKMTQRNTRTNKLRTIRRASGDEQGPMQPPTSRPMKRAMKTRSKRLPSAMKRTMKSVAKRRPKVAMKSMKRVSKIGTKKKVFKGTKLKTKGGLKADDLMKSKKGKVVSKKLHTQGKKSYERNLSAWVRAFSKARLELKLVGFVPIKKGSEFYNRTKALMSS